MMRVFLIGPRGSGKTSTAEALAGRLGWDWVDMDPVIEQRAGLTIAELFAQQGEGVFRDYEAALLSELCSRERLVVATGGGVVLRPENRALLRESGVVVWLQAPADVLWSRIAADPSTRTRRPALAGGGREEIARLVADREALYGECADYSIDTVGCSPDEAARRAVVLLSARPVEPSPR